MPVPQEVFLTSFQRLFKMARQNGVRAICLGSIHNDDSIEYDFLRPKVAIAMVENGYHNFAIEQDYDLQGIIDYHTGIGKTIIDPAKRQENINNLCLGIIDGFRTHINKQTIDGNIIGARTYAAALIGSSAISGLKIHAADSSGEQIERLKQYLTEKCGGMFIYDSNWGMISSLSPQDIMRYHEILDFRSDRDAAKLLAKRIKQESMVLHYGVGHFSHDQGMDCELNAIGLKTAKIFICTSKRYIKEFWPEIGSDSNFPCCPKLGLCLEDGKFYNLVTAQPTELRPGLLCIQEPAAQRPAKLVRTPPDMLKS